MEHFSTKDKYAASVLLLYSVVRIYILFDFYAVPQSNVTL